jgi:hypothetical protein
MLTTITVNGTEGLRFLTGLASRPLPPPLEGQAHPQTQGQTQALAMPPALAAMVDHVTKTQRVDLDNLRLEVTAPLADEIASFVETISNGGVPLLFSAEIGDLVMIVRDVLAEIQGSKRGHKTWRFIAAGSRGRLVGRRGDLGKVQLIEGTHRVIAIVSERCTTRSRALRDRRIG